MFSIRKSIQSIVVFGFFVPGIAAAQEIAKPSSAWLVGPAALNEVDAERAGGVPCVAVNQFSNGYTVRLSGGGGQLMAMAVDTRRDQFTPHEKVEIQLSFPGSYFNTFSGAAFDSRTVLVSLHKFPEVYAAMKEAETLDVTVGGTKTSLILSGLKDGFNRMEKCFQPARVAAGVVGGTQSSYGTQPPARPPVQPRTRQNPLLVGEGERLTPMPGDAPPPVAGLRGPDPAESVNALVAPMGRDPRTTSDLLVKAQEAEEAAKKLSAMNPNRPNAPVSQGVPLAESWSDPTVRRANPTNLMGQAAPSALQGDAARPMRWRALKGANLRDTLDVWARGVGVRMIWNAPQDFSVLQSIVFEGPFDQAAGALLEQYSTQSTRPVGKVYREPGGTGLVLVVNQAWGQ
jgi:hypothetical protein